MNAPARSIDMTIMEALYQCFTSTIVFPNNREKMHYQTLASWGYIEEATQGHATGFRILPKGYEAAMAHWGHTQSP